MTGPSGARVSEARRGDPDQPRLDLRLAASAGSGWLACAVALHQSASFAVAALIAGALACIGGLVIATALDKVARARLVRAGAMLAAAGAGVVIVCAPLVPRISQARAGAVTALAQEGRSVEVEAVIAEEPRLSARPDPGGAARATAILGVRSIRLGSGGWSDAGGQILVLGAAEDWLGRTPTQRLRVHGALAPGRGAGLLAGVMFADGAPTLVGSPRPWFAWSDAVRADLRGASSVLPPAPRGLLPGLVLGDVSGMDAVLSDRFRAAGLAHLTAVSGANVAIIVSGVLFLLRRARVPTLWCALLGSAAILGFVILARPSPSVIRAAIMAAVAMAGLGLGRARQASPMLCCAVLGALVWRPSWALDVGFGMSVVATGALVAIAPVWALWLRRRGIPGVAADVLAVAAAATAATLPLSVAISGRLSLLAAPANILAAPAVPLATLLGVLAALCATVWPGGGELLARAAGVPCAWLVDVAERMGAPQMARLPWAAGWLGAGLAVLLLVVFGLAIRHGAAAMLVCALLSALLVDAPLRDATGSWPPQDWRFVACDVGQGDGLVLYAGPESAIVVDAGPAAVPIDRCLADLGVRDVPLLVITHFDADHVGGIAGVFHGRAIGRVVTGGGADPDSGHRLAARVLADYGRPASDLESAQRGQSLRVGAATIEVLSAPVMRGTRSDSNNSSLVLRATIDGVRILLAGDSEVEEQQEMLRAGVSLDADVLKVPHHGSAHVDQRWIAATTARTAIISVGAGNTYGQPAPKLLRMLGDASMTVLRTDQLSDIAIAIGGDGWRTTWRGKATRPAARAPPRPVHGACAGTPCKQARVTGWPDGC